MDRQTLALAVSDRRPACAPNAIACLVPAGPARQQRTLVTPELALSWAPSPQWRLFARSARSARLPGWNLLARTSAELVLLPAETGWHHQVGMKAELWDGRVRLDASGFAARTRALVSPLFGIDPLAMAVAATLRLDMTNHGAGRDAGSATARPAGTGSDAGLAAGALDWSRAGNSAHASALCAPTPRPACRRHGGSRWSAPVSVLVPRVAARWRSAMAVGPALGLTDGMSPGGWQVAAACSWRSPMVAG